MAHQMPLEAEYTSQNTVDCRAGHLIITRLLPHGLADDPGCCCNWEKQAVEMIEQFNPQPRFLRYLGKARFGVATMVMVRHVMRAPHPGIGGHSQQNFAAGFQLAFDVRQRGQIIANMLQHIEQRDHIIAAIGNAR